MPSPPPNAYPPGTKLVVGSHSVSIVKYISEGGFAHVYTCEMDRAFNGSKIGCLKRVVVPNKVQLSLLRQEVDAMKRLRGNKRIVSYIDSHASRLGSSSSSNGPSSEQQYEVLLLMEYCERNGLIDFMNARLVHKLTEPEILNILYDVTIGVAMCHHLQPPLIHRDIKIENVLIDSHGTFKLCDFGSAVGYIAPPKSIQDLKKLREDVMSHTTPQYRAPEMIDLEKGFPIDDKSDIWALGCFLYKLCYYTTPFESPHHKSLQDLESSILNNDKTLRFNDQPGSMFTPRLKNIIKCCLRGDPRRRPNAVQLLGEICAMRGEKVPDVIPYCVKEMMNSQVKTKPSIDESLLKPKSRTTDGKIEGRNEPNIVSAKTQDPFASIDKSRFLSSNSQNIGRVNTASRDAKRQSMYSLSVPNLDSAHNTTVDQSKLGNRSSSSLKSYIQSQLDKSSEDLSRSRDGEEKDGDTLDFLKSKEEEYNTNKALRNDTGGSFKATLKNGLRKISTGSSSIHSSMNNHTGNNHFTNRNSKRSSITSLKSLINSNSNRKVSGSDDSSDDDIQPTEGTVMRKLSIQRRVQMLFNESKGTSTAPKSAKGYGKYTDQRASEDLNAINDTGINEKFDGESNINLEPPRIPPTLSSKKTPSRTTLTKNSRKVTPPTRESLKYDSKQTPKKAPPPKPKKPVYLKSPHKSTGHERTLSNSSEISLSDLEEREKHFAERFPSYV